MEPTRSPFPPSRDSQFAATGAPFGATAAPYGATVAPFTGTSAPFMGTQSPFGGPGGPGGRPPGTSDDFSFKELLDMIGHSLLVIRAKWYWGLAGALVVGGLVGFYLFSKPVEYDAQTDILAESTLDQVIGTQSDSP